MFEKRKDEAVAVDDEHDEGGRGDITVLSVGPGLVLTQIGRKLVLVAEHCRGGPVTRNEFPLPPGRGPVRAGAWNGPTVVRGDVLYVWTRGDERWQPVASLRGDA